MYFTRISLTHVNQTLRIKPCKLHVPWINLAQKAYTGNAITETTIPILASILQHDAFSHPGRAILRVMAMTTGELDYSDLYHQQEGEHRIAFPQLSYYFWIIFLVLMPVLLINLLVSYLVF